MVNSKMFEVWFLDGEPWNNRQIEAKLKAYDIEDVTEWIKATYTAYEFNEIDISTDETAYMFIDMCKDCEYNECLDCDTETQYDINLEKCRDCHKYGLTPCESCQLQETFEIIQVEDTDEELMLVLPTCHSQPRSGGFLNNNAYHDLTRNDETC